MRESLLNLLFFLVFIFLTFFSLFIEFSLKLLNFSFSHQLIPWFGVIIRFFCWGDKMHSFLEMFKVNLSSMKVFFEVNFDYSCYSSFWLVKEANLFNLFLVVIFLIITVCLLPDILFGFVIKVEALSKFLFVAFEGLNIFCYSSSSKFESDPLEESSLLISSMCLFRASKN